MTERGELLTQVLAFIERYHLTDTQFGHMAVNSPKFVFDLRKGRHSHRPATLQRVRDFMAAGDPRTRNTRSRFARRYASTVRANAANEVKDRAFRLTDDVERAKRYLRQRGSVVFDATVAAENKRMRAALAGKLYVGTQLYDRDEFLDLARRRGWAE